MADKVDKKLAACLSLPTTVQKKQQQHKAPLLPAVQLTSLWALLTAAILAVSYAVGFALVQGHIHTPSWMSPRAGSFTDAAAAEVSAIIFHGVVWCTAAQAAAAALALLLPGRRCRLSRRALACVALAAAATSHLMLARVVALYFTADPGCVTFWIVGALDVSYLAAWDLYCFLALLGRGAYANDLS
ncbi:unnamed protein product [Urochloa decumbens]|uniref:Uncharacterized protein n=1 Tax=Urochloa decumbens TaxID=240449 RepID=A0ABC8Z1M9_9POAL